MNTDIRLLLSFRTHPKTKKLRLKLGDAGPLGFIFLMMHAAESKPDGILDGMDQDDIGLAADYRGDVGEFVDTLVALRLLDFDGETYSIHDFLEHQPWVSSAPERKEKAKKAADIRWGNAEPPTKKQRVRRKNDAPSMNEHCSEHDLALLKSQSSNAPSPYLSVSLPSPKPKSISESAAVPTVKPSSSDPPKKTAAAKFDYSSWRPDEPCLARIRATDHDVTVSFIETERLDFITYAEDNGIPERMMRTKFQSQVHRRWIEAKARERNGGPLRSKDLRDIRDIPVDELEAWSKAREGPPPDPGESADDYRKRIVKTLRDREREPARTAAIEQTARAVSVN